MEIAILHQIDDFLIVSAVNEFYEANEWQQSIQFATAAVDRIMILWWMRRNYKLR